MTKYDPPAFPDPAQKAVEVRSRREQLRWLRDNPDGLAALLIGFVAAILGLFNIVPMPILDSAILATLTVLAFTVLRDRRDREQAEERAKTTYELLTGKLTPLVTAMQDFPQLRRAIDQMKDTVQGSAAVKTMRGPAALEPVFRDAREHTEHWTFRGGTGTYTRAKTLPQCVEIAKNRVGRGRMTINLMILDPSDEQLCRRYARYRATLPEPVDGTGEGWTMERTQKESYATVLAAGWHKRRYDPLEIRVYLTSTMSTFRYDMSDSQLIITQDDPQFPAMVIPKSSQHYDAYATELDESRKQARPIIVEGPSDQLAADDGLSIDMVRQFFGDVSLPLPGSYGDDIVQEIIDKATHARNPFPEHVAANGGRS